MRVAFNLIDSARWTGGYNYLLNLIQGYPELRGGSYQPDTVLR